MSIVSTRLAKYGESGRIVCIHTALHSLQDLVWCFSGVFDVTLSSSSDPRWSDSSRFDYLIIHIFIPSIGTPQV